MILINLLPHREERRKRRKAAFFAGLGLSAVFGLAIVGGWYVVVQQLMANQQHRNQFLTAEIKKLEVQIKDIAALRAEIDSLKARQRAVEDLQVDRNVPVHLLNELVRQTPEGMYITTVKQDGSTLGVTGIAQTQERVSEFLRNTAYNAEWLVKPDLIETKSTTVQQKRLFDFSLRLSINRPQDIAAAAAAASAPSAKPPGAQPAPAVASVKKP